MRWSFAVLFAFAVPAVPCHAQVITGESTYEDNFLHNPPAADDHRGADQRETRTDRDARAPEAPPAAH